MARLKGSGNGESQLDGRRTVIAELYLRGTRTGVIAEQLGVSVGVVRDDLAVVRREWQRQAVLKIDQRKAQELAKLDSLESTYWEAWERSRQDAVTTTSERVPIPVDPASALNTSDMLTLKEVTRTEGQAGDPRFLEGIERCIEKRCRILGIIKREVIQGGGSDNRSDVSVVVYLPDNGRIDSTSPAIAAAVGVNVTAGNPSATGPADGVPAIDS